MAGRFPLRLAPEASGLVAGRRNPGLLYVLDDGPGTTSLLVLRARNAKVVGRLRIEGLDGTDTEALAAGACGPDGGRCLYVGDIGDNLRTRPSITVWRIAEPDLSAGVPAAAVPAEQIELRYPNRPYDAEALLAGADGSLLVVTKHPRARLFTAGPAGGTLRRAGRVRVPLPALPLAAAVVGNVVTGADSSPGGVLLRTYDAVFEYRAPAPDADVARFASWPVTEVRAAAEPQGEAVAYGSDGCSYFTVSEGSGALSVSRCRP